MGDEHALVPIERIEQRILVIRGQRVMLDRDLAALYGVPTNALKQAVRRNMDRFPPDFMFILTAQELANWRSQFVTSNSERMGLRYAPMAFTEQGVAMLSSVLRSARAVRMNIAIMRAFVRMREVLNTRKEFAEKLAELERKLATHDIAIRGIVDAIKLLAVLPPTAPDKPKIGFGVKEAAAPYRRRKRRVLTHGAGKCQPRWKGAP